MNFFMAEIFDSHLSIVIKSFPICLYRETFNGNVFHYVNGATSGDDLYRLLQNLPMGVCKGFLIVCVFFYLVGVLQLSRKKTNVTQCIFCRLKGIRSF